MCGRFALTLPDDAMAALFDAAPANDLPGIPNFNICPTTRIHTVTSDDGSRHLRAMRWGLIPFWYKTPSDGPLLINARGETVAEKPAFKSAVRDRRCLIPASGFYEWTKDESGNRLPWYIQPRKSELLAFAGIWQTWERGDEALTTCAIVTTAANETMNAIHNRMPVIIGKKEWPLWLGEAGKGAATLLRPAPEDDLIFHRVDPKVNSNRAQGAELIEAV